MSKTGEARMARNGAEDAGEANGAAIAYGALDRRMGYALRRAQLAVFNDFFRTVATFEISAAEYSVLTIIENNPGLTQTQVADALGIKKTNFVALIKRLEDRGLVSRQSLPHDRRSFALHLTPAGDALIAKLHAASDAHEARIRALVGEARYQALFEPLHALATGLGGVAQEP